MVEKYEARSAEIVDRVQGMRPSLTDCTRDKVAEVLASQLRDDHISSWSDFIEKRLGERVDRLAGQLIIDVGGEEGYDKSVVYGMPFGLGFDYNMLYQIASLRDYLPEGTRIVSQANPTYVLGGLFGGYPKSDFDSLDSSGKRNVGGGDFAPSFESIIQHLQDTETREADFFGYSLGASTILDIARTFDGTTHKIICQEPVAYGQPDQDGLHHTAELARLGVDFMRSGPKLNDYVRMTGLETFEEARAACISAVPWFLGLLRSTNLTLAKGLSAGGYFRELTAARNSHPDASIYGLWGDRSIMSDVDVLQKGFDSVGGKTEQIVGGDHSSGNFLALTGSLAVDYLS